MKIIVVGDTHGTQWWKWIVYTQEFDLIIFIGDYFDSPSISCEDQISNFKDICKLKRNDPHKAILLIGNHDFHYTKVAIEANEKYEGFQYAHVNQIKEAIEQGRDVMQMAYQWRNYLFTHAGVTSKWIQSTQKLAINLKPEQTNIADYINNVYKDFPECFFFSGKDLYGDDITQSPIMVRPNSLCQDAFYSDDSIQVVGHTPVKSIIGKAGKFIFIDTLRTSKEFLVIEDENWHVEKIKI